MDPISNVSHAQTLLKPGPRTNKGTMLFLQYLLASFVVATKSEVRPPIQYIPLGHPAFWSDTSHGACRIYLDFFADLNIRVCRRPPSKTAVSGAVYAHNARFCYNQTICHIESQCRVVRDYRGCSMKYLADGLIGFWGMFCRANTTPMVNELSKPRNRVGKCLTDAAIQELRRNQEIQKKTDVTFRVPGSLQNQLNANTQTMEDLNLSTTSESKAEASPTTAARSSPTDLFDMSPYILAEPAVDEHVVQGAYATAEMAVSQSEAFWCLDWSTQDTSHK